MRPLLPRACRYRTVDKAPRVRTGQELSPSPDSESGAVELGVLVPLVLVTNVIAAIVVWFAVGALLR
jgi:hypothetical protein